MKTETAVASGWDDLIFENRNKEYGAYDLRKSYSGNATSAMMICMLAAAGILVLSQISFFSDEKPPGEMKNAGGTLVWDEFKIKAVKPEIKPQQHVTTKTFKKDLQVAVVKHDVIDKPEEKIDDQEQTTSPTGDIGFGQTETSGGDTPGGSVETTPLINVNSVFNGAEVMPSYKEGMDGLIKFMQRKLVYPSRSKRQNIEGTVFVEFVVNREGKVVDLKVVRGISEDCDREAIRVISSMPAWNPGSQQGIPVSVRMVLPVRFKLNSI